MMLRNCLAGVTAALLCLCMTACNETLISPTATKGSKPTSTPAKPTTTTTATTSTTVANTSSTTTTKPADGNTDTQKPQEGTDVKENGVGTVYADKQLGFQLEKPEVGEQIAILHTSKGDISIRLFPEAAPKAVENFVTHAKNGYYNGLTFHRVVEDFMIQGGDPKGNGTGGQSIWGKDFEDEFDQKLINLTGAVSMANNGEDTNGSQFFINQCDPAGFGDRETYSPEYREKVAKQLYEQMVQSYGQEQVDKYYPDGWKSIITDRYVYEWIPDEAWELYKKHGGNLHLDGPYRREGGNTVFGQVFEGLDTVKAISKVVTDSNGKPVVTVTINSVEITTYQG